MPNDSERRDARSARLDPARSRDDGRRAALDGEREERGSTVDADGLGLDDPVANDPGAVDSAEGREGVDDSDPNPDDRFDALDRRLTALEAELDSVRGLLGGVEAVDEAVERRASIALAKVEALERSIDADESGLVRERLRDVDGGEAGGAEAAGIDTAGADSEDYVGGADGANLADGAGGADYGGAADRRGHSPAAGNGGADAPDDDSLASRLRDAFR